MITLKKLSWDNCFSYGDGNEVNLNSTNLTQILGTNGVGKSSIPLIIEEVLFNKNSKGIKKADLPNRYKDGSYSITLELEKDGVEYLVEVLRKGTSIKVKLLRNGEDISSHTATNTFKTIQDEIIGIDFKTFSQLVYQNTNASLQFLTATDTARKKFLIDLLGLEDYVAYYEGFKEIVKSTNTKIAVAEGTIATVQNWLTNNKLASTASKEIQDLPIVPQEFKEQMDKYLIELHNISTTNKSIVKNNQFKKLLSLINIDEVNGITETEMVSYDHLQKQLGHESSTQDSAKRIIAKIENLHGVCPTCTQEIDESKINELIIENSKAVGVCQDQIVRLNAEIKQITAANKRYESKTRQLKEFEDLYRSINRKLPTELLNEAELSEKVKLLHEKMHSIAIEVQKIEMQNRDAVKHNTRIQIIQEQTNKFESDLNSSTKELEDLQEVCADLEVLKKAFSTNGLLAYKIENLVKELEELTNDYLAELSDGRFTIEFVVNNDKLNVEITDNGAIVDILALSSGELARVNTATLLAIRKLMSSISKTKINILFLDEVISVLDEQGKEKLVEILLKEEELNSYLISHGWTHPLVEKIEIAKRNNISYLE